MGHYASKASRTRHAQTATRRATQLLPARRCLICLGTQSDHGVGHYDLVHRLRLAGCELPLFETPAVEAIFQAASGLPRRANALAHHALFAAAIQKAKSINTEHVQAAMQEVS